MKKIRIMLVDDHTILRDGVRFLLGEEPDLEVVAEAEDGRTAVELTDKKTPDVVVMDIGLPLLNGLEATRQIKRNHPCIKVLVLTMHEDEEYIRSVLAAGASGYLLKDAAARELIHAIRTVFQGDSILSPPVTRLVLNDYLRWGDHQPDLDETCLTTREREVLQLIAEGHTNKGIAQILCISVKTVGAHRHNLMKKLDLHNQGELIKYAIQKKVIEV